MSTDDGTSRVVVGVDGSLASHAALRWALRHARRTGATVHAVGAYDLPGAGGWSAPAVDVLFDEEQARRSLSEELAEVLAPEDDVLLVQHVVRGNPAQVLIDESDGAELLVVGSRGRGGFASLLLGSVSQQCAAHASCPVVIVRPETADGTPPAGDTP
ncbi:universal stress protein [Streptomyces sp. NPDC056529]|uniref:universal stress protein n=1 Tax=Streptomyces sp. NPDC056529 TaxID=3345855 RepID=UPI0036CD8B1B